MVEETAVHDDGDACDDADDDTSVKRSNVGAAVSVIDMCDDVCCSKARLSEDDAGADIAAEEEIAQRSLGSVPASKGKSREGVRRTRESVTSYRLR